MSPDILLIVGIASGVIGTATVSSGATVLVRHWTVDRRRDRRMDALEERVIRLRAQLHQRRMPTLDDAAAEWDAGSPHWAATAEAALGNAAVLDAAATDLTRGDQWACLTHGGGLR